MELKVFFKDDDDLIIQNLIKNEKTNISHIKTEASVRGVDTLEITCARPCKSPCELLDDNLEIKFTKTIGSIEITIQIKNDCRWNILTCPSLNKNLNMLIFPSTDDFKKGYNWAYEIINIFNETILDTIKEIFRNIRAVINNYEDDCELER